MKISVVIITHNEESNIKRCLQSVAFAEEIIVIDSFSRDDTVKIAAAFTSNIIKRNWEGFSKQKNYGISRAKNEWILSIDADEVLSEDLRLEIKDLQKTRHSGFYIKRKPFFMGKFIKHCGWYPDRQLRLFKKSAGRFDEKKLVHEGVLLKGSKGNLKNELLHFPYSSIGGYFEQFNKYTSLAAQQYLKDGREFSRAGLVFSPLATFIKMYFLRRGFLDGFAGFCICVLSSCYNFVKYAKLWELTGRK
ncbi:MAG: glycosyltransferase family 2 protein [Candidatus Firestonebacteria bacterium]|nr:glycosyltransferase family 2 protein [Candidatus Firestonebacteria bacterium]